MAKQQGRGLCLLVGTEEGEDEDEKEKRRKLMKKKWYLGYGRVDSAYNLLCAAC